MASLRPVCLTLLAFAGVTGALKNQPVTGGMEDIGRTMGTVEDSVDSVGKRVGADKLGDAAGDAVNSAGGAVGRGARSVGIPPAEKIEHVPVVGQSFKVNALSTALSCVISLTVQYLIVYTALAIVRMWADYLNFKYADSTLVEVLQQGALTVNLAPMLACLFMACRMRVNWLTQGKGNPPTHVQVWMLIATYAVLCMTLTALVIPIFTGETVKLDDRGHIEEDHNPFKMPIVAIVFTVFKYLIMIGLYVGVLCIIYGIINYTPPAGSWPGDGIPPPSPAVACTMILTSVYFLVYAFIQIGKTFLSFVPTFTYVRKVIGALEGAVCTMAFAPMLSVLFIAARMRALQMDPIYGRPQSWAQSCFYACTYSVMIQCIFAIAVPLVVGGEAKVSESKTRSGIRLGYVEYEVPNRWCGIALSVVRWIVMLGIYLGFTAVIWSIFVLQHPRGAEFTPPISVTMQCVINLAVQYFFVYLLVWVGHTASTLTGWWPSYLTNTMDNATGTVNFCPMIAILFVGTRMRALRLTNNRGAPQGWAQDGMYCATWAILIQFLMVLLVPLAVYLMEGKMDHPEVDADGNTTWQPKSEGSGWLGKAVFIVVQIIRWLGFFLLYGGVITVIVGAITMTPETANGRGSLPLARETPFGKEPVGPNDIPGMPPQGHGPPRDSGYSA